VAFPGWIRYGTFYSERNTWWPYFRKWADYKARISYVLQNAVPQANVAILQPLTDLWLKHGPQRDPFPRKRYPAYQFNLWEAVNQNGGGCDYVSENIIKQSTFKNGQMVYNGRSYSVLLLPEIETLDVETAKTLAAFAKSGGKIVFIGKKPFQSPAYRNTKAAGKRVAEIVNGMLTRYKANVLVYPAPQGDLIEWYGKLQDKLIKPYVRFDKTHKFLSQSSYRIGGNSVYLIANTSMSEHISVKADFQVDSGLHPWIWNPETGERKLYPTNGSNKSLELEIPRATSLLIVFEKNSRGELFKPLNLNTKGKEVTGKWQLHLNHIDGSRHDITLESLTDLIKNSQTKHFAGEVIYEKTINLAADKYRYIDLGDVQGVSELRFNGKYIGTRWHGAHVYDISDAAKEGENKLSIKLTTITGNYLKSLKDNATAQRWTKRQPYHSMGIIGPVKLETIDRK
jgi:hypothetical protein